MDDRERVARFAGMLYLLMIVTGYFTVMYVPAKLMARGDAAATASRILAAEPLFRFSMLIGLISTVVFLFLSLALYRLLKEVNQPLAAVMVILVLGQVPMVLVDELMQLAALILIRGADFLAVFDQHQREALALLLLDVNGKGTIVAGLFWGLWLLPLGLLVFRSGYLPRVLGVWLIINCAGYVAISVIGLLWPQHLDVVNRVTFPALLGEVAFMLWLLILGARPGPVQRAAQAVG
jgi:hypothetical protein